MGASYLFGIYFINGDEAIAVPLPDYETFAEADVKCDELNKSFPTPQYKVLISKDKPNANQ